MGLLGTIQKNRVGNFLTLRLDSQAGLWEISVKSTAPYSLKVVGQSAIDFLFDFVEVATPPCWVSVTGSDSVRLREVALVEAEGLRQNVTWSPEIPFSLLFTVTTNGTGGSFTIRATNDRGFTSSSPTNLKLVTGVSANGTVTLTAPANTESGTDVTLPIEAESPGATDTNYAVLPCPSFHR
ncbi:hypothetical protein J4Q44_G00129790 [Coregonus suidteri]|uniref:Uncharacterized protein n=1 Tax=Coregonus suidteri TaxID=861788 RepID=A0AAN8LWF7_9TELE